MSDSRPICYKFGPFYINVPERVLLKDGEPVPLTPKTFDLLLTLVANRGRLVTKERLISLVWPNTFIEENNLAVHVSALRKILGNGGDGKDFIKTVPKRGYSFGANVQESLGPSSSTANLRSIGVLPFMVASSESGDDLLGLGLCDAIITRLSQISQMMVRPTTAVSKYAGRAHDPIQAGQELAVEAVLSGRITRSGDQVRVTVQLVDVLANSLLWADKLDHSFTDVFSCEDFISEHVARALKLKLTGDQIDRLTKRHTVNGAAYWAYLKGRYYWAKRSPAGVKKALDYFQYASDKDPSYSLAYSGLSDCYTLLNYYGGMPAKVGRQKAVAAAQKALAADDSLAEAHSSMALTKFWYDWEWLGAEIEFERALELNPSYATAHQWYCWYLVAMGRYEESLAEGQRALQLDPLAPAINMALGKTFLFSRRYDESIGQCERTLELDPDFIPAHYFLGQAYEQKGIYEKAIDHYQVAMELTSGFPLGKAVLAKAQALAGDRAEAETTLHSLLELSKSSGAYVPAYGIALIHLGLRDTTQAIQWLEKTYDERFIWLVYLNVDPVYDSLRGEFGFKRLVKRMAYPHEITRDSQIALGQD